MKFKAIIVDDERLARKELRSLLGENAEIQIVGEASSVSEAIRLIEKEQPEVVFLDIQLSGETGFDLLENIEAEFKTVFVTAYDAYAIRAFEVNALDYLLKPVNPERLRQAIEKLSETDPSEVRAVSSLRPLEFDDRLFLPIGERSIFLKINTISHILAAGDYTEVFTVDRKKFLTNKPLREWEDRLPEKHFTRIHRSAIVNLERVERVESWFKRSFQIYLQNQAEPFTVSRRFAAKLKEKFG